MKPRTIGSKLLIIATTVLAIAIAGSAEAKHGGEGWHGGADGTAEAGVAGKVGKVAGRGTAVVVGMAR